MTDSFDPYDQWLGIPAAQQPANHYRLFGLPLFEGDPDVIANATQRVMAQVRTYQIGPRSEYSQQLLNELAAARVCLKDAEKKKQYDSELRTQLAPPKLPPSVQTQPATVGPAAVEPPIPASIPTTLTAQPATSTTDNPYFGWTKTDIFDWRKRVLKPQSIWIAISLTTFVLGTLVGSWVRLPRGQPTTSNVASPLEAQSSPVSPAEVPSHPVSPSEAQSHSVLSAEVQSDPGSPVEVAIDPVKPPKEQQRFFADGPLEAPPGTEARKLVIWNQNNGQTGNRGTKTSIVRLFRGNHEIWASDEIEVQWKPDGPASTTVELPPRLYDRLRVDVTSWHGVSGGLAELQLFDGENEIAQGCPARASSSIHHQYFPKTINDGITTSAQKGLGYWVLPDGVPGWIEIDVSRPVVEDAAVIADEVVLWNSHNALSNNAGTKVFDLTLLKDRQRVWSQEEVTLSWEQDRDHSLSVQVPQIEFDAVRIDVRESELFPGLSEIEIIRDGQNIALGCPARASSSFNVLARPSRVVDGVRNSNQYRVGYWFGKTRGSDWIEVDLSCCNKELGATNQQTAEYYCFQRHDWPRGLQWFARCSDPQFRLLAAQDQAPGNDNAALISVADQWWELSEQATGLAQDALKLRALQHYAKTIPRVDSFLRRRLEDRLNTEIKKFDAQDYLYFNPTAKVSGIHAASRVRQVKCSINGRPYNYGIWMHPTSKNSSRVAYDTNGQYGTLTGSVGINDSARVRSVTPLIFRVEGDGETLWESEPIQELHVTTPLRVEISGVQRLELVVHCPGSNHLAHAVWLDPRLGR